MRSFKPKAFLALLVLAASLGNLRASDMPLEALLVWGTNDGSSPKPEHKLLDGDLRKKFDAMPFKWKNYFEEKRVAFRIGTNQYTRVTINGSCSFDVKDLGSPRVKVKLYGLDKEVVRHEKPLPAGETLIFAGDDKNDKSQSAWFIVIQHPKVPPPAAKPAALK
ncbi:MAG: hypothetical protein FJ405_01725 [Verrucomicrobia bacterium]|nr:hypothetical protein [Verrucomicrobiota bacterium]